MNHNAEKLIAIIMRNHNAFDLTHDCIKSLKKTSYTNKLIIVVDDGTLDNSGEKIQKIFPDVLLLKSEKYIEYCRGLNLGINKAMELGAEYFFLINNDTNNFSENYFEELVNCFNKIPDIGLIGTMCYDYDKKTRWDGRVKCKMGVPMDTPTEGYIIKREVFEKIGGLNNFLIRYFEDLDFLIRMRTAGYKSFFLQTVSFDHLGGGTSSKQYFIPNYYRVRNLLLFLKYYCKSYSLKWKIKEFRKNISVHLRRVKIAIKNKEIKSIVFILSGILFGIVIGSVISWKSDCEL